MHAKQETPDTSGNLRANEEKRCSLVTGREEVTVVTTDVDGTVTEPLMMRRADSADGGRSPLDLTSPSTSTRTRQQQSTREGTPTPFAPTTWSESSSAVKPHASKIHSSLEKSQSKSFLDASFPTLGDLDGGSSTGQCFI